MSFVPYPISVFFFFIRSSYFSGGVFLLLCSRTRYASTWFAYLDSLALVFLWITVCDHRICISRMKNQEEHWGYRRCRWVERTVLCEDTTTLSTYTFLCTTQLAKLSFNHSIRRTHSWRFSTFCKKYPSLFTYGTRYVLYVLSCRCFSAIFVTPTLPAPSGAPNTPPFSLRLRTLPAPCGVVASARLCCLSHVPPAVCPSVLESATTVCTSFLQSLSTYVHTRRRHIPYYDSGPPHKHQIYIHTSNLPLCCNSGPGKRWCVVCVVIF